jgi:hypothetical protein
MDSAMGMQQYLSKSMKDNSQIGKHLAGKRFWTCTEIYDKPGAFPKLTAKHPLQQIVHKEETTLKMVGNSPTTKFAQYLNEPTCCE